jgi:hypothetical protein
LSRRFQAALAGLAAACAVTTMFALATPSQGSAPAGCTRSGYSYAGMAGEIAVSGARAEVTALSAPDVHSGHVAGWVGVGGRGLGPNGSNEWLQAGIVSYEGTGARLYYELMLPSGRRYVELGAVRAGERHVVEIVESIRETWVVQVDGRAVSPAIPLGSSHGRWPAVVTSESWIPDGAPCNGYAFRFGSVAFRNAKGAWRSDASKQTITTTKRERTRFSSSATFVAKA